MGRMMIGLGLGKTVYAGRTKTMKDGTVMWSQKEDCTSDFYNTIVALLTREENRDGIYIGTPDNPEEFTLKLEKLDKKPFEQWRKDYPAIMENADSFELADSFNTDLFNAFEAGRKLRDKEGRD